MLSQETLAASPWKKHSQTWHLKVSQKFRILEKERTMPYCTRGYQEYLAMPLTWQKKYAVFSRQDVWSPAKRFKYYVSYIKKPTKFKGTSLSFTKLLGVVFLLCLFGRSQGLKVFQLLTPSVPYDYMALRIGLSSALVAAKERVYNWHSSHGDQVLGSWYSKHEVPVQGFRGSK